ncbi:MAG TPA: hypothetical protein VF703_18565 [Pyrinomonadaceae bacterium]|jgi:hypothetical protein
MLNLSGTILLLSCFTLLLPVVSCAQQKVEASSCNNQLIYPNADLDNFESPVVGNVRQIQIQETDLSEDTQSDLVKTINYNEQGKMTDTFLSDSKIKVFGKTLYSYDDKNRLIREVIYNPNGEAASEKVFEYDSSGNLKRVITQNPQSKVVIWNKEFSYEPKKNYTELFDKLHGYGFGFYKDEKCRITELTSYKSDRTVTSKLLVQYDDEKHVVEKTAYSPAGKIIGKKQSEFQFDGQGNWIKQTKYEPSLVGENLVYKPVAVVNRKIIYFDKK